MITLEEAKLYLRVDTDYDDKTIVSMIASAEALCADSARLSAEEWNVLNQYTGDGGLIIRSEEKSHSEVLHIRELLHTGILYTLGYLYEHREEADHHDLSITLRNILSSIREGVI